MKFLCENSSNLYDKYGAKCKHHIYLFFVLPNLPPVGRAVNPFVVLQNNGLIWQRHCLGQSLWLWLMLLKNYNKTLLCLSLCLKSSKRAFCTNHFGRFWKANWSTYCSYTKSVCFFVCQLRLNNRELSNQTWRTGTSKDGSNMEEKSEEKRTWMTFGDFRWLWVK